ncbi:MAG: hypothetical protein ACP5UQ_12325, partial [Anaerolineae bacterium]
MTPPDSTTHPHVPEPNAVIEPAVRSEEQGDPAIRELYQIVADQDADFRAKIRALLAMGCRRFEMSTGILSHVEGTRFEVLEACSADDSIRGGDVFELGPTYCCDALIATEPIAFEHAA